MKKRFGMRNIRSVCAAAVVTFAFPLRADGAETPPELQCSFFDSATVNDTVIRLGDIARVSVGAEGIPQRELMNLPVGEAAPPGYSRFVNTEDVVRYFLAPGKTPYRVARIQGKRISVKTDFREIGLSSIESDLIRAITGAIQWPKDDYQLKTMDKNQSLKCLKMPFSTSFEGLPSPYPKGNFNCKVTIRQGSKLWKFPVSCHISVTTPVLVSSVPIKRGVELSAENCHIEKVDITHFNYMPYTEISRVRNRTISRSVNAGAIIHEKLTAKVPIVRRDEVVKLIAIQGNIRACITAKARESGGEGSLILVENEMTHKLMKAKIVGEGQVVLFYGNEGI
jgi:flagella basal body P-ring formation protein FlgA